MKKLWDEANKRLIFLKETADSECKSCGRKTRHFNFELLEQVRYDGIKGLKDEIKLIRPFLQKIYQSHNWLIRIVKYVLNTLTNPIAGHMCFMVFKKA